MNLSTLKFQLVFPKEDNPDLPEDLVVRRGIACTKFSRDADPKTFDWEKILLVEVDGAMRAAIHRLRADGYLEEPE